MKCEDISPWGAKIERGRITARHEDSGKYTYDIESIDRPGALFYAMPGDGQLETGGNVYFFAFEDGKGFVMTQIP